ncbi:MAG: hypothetical protein QW728_02765 [Thermoplasmata archaeon]
MKIAVRKAWVRNEKGSIEGLPLQLLIMIVIAAVGLGILLAWLQGVDKLKNIGSVVPIDDPSNGKLIKSVELNEVDYFNEEAVWQGGTTLYIKVYDKENNPLPGAMVTLSGCGAFGSKETSNQEADKGVATFNGVVFRLSMGTQASNVLVKVTKTNYGDGGCQIPVTRGPNGDNYIYNS